MYIALSVIYSVLHVCCCCLLAQPCLTHCDPMDCSPPGSSVHGILQARTLEWVAMPSSKGSSQPRSPALLGILYPLSHRQAQEYWRC